MFCVLEKNSKEKVSIWRKLMKKLFKIKAHKGKVGRMFCSSSNRKTEQLWPIRGLLFYLHQTERLNCDFMKIKTLSLISLLPPHLSPPSPTPVPLPRLPRLPLTCLFILPPPTVSVLQTVLVSAGQCDSVFKGFSDCLLQLGEKMATYPQDLDDRENLHKICGYVRRGRSHEQKHLMM